MLYSGCIMLRCACKTLGRHTAHMFFLNRFFVGIYHEVQTSGKIKRL